MIGLAGLKGTLTSLKVNTMVNDHQIISHSYTTTLLLIWPSNVTPYVRGEEESG